MTIVRVFSSPWGLKSFKVNVESIENDDPYSESVKRSLLIKCLQEHAQDMNLSPEKLERTMVDLYPVETNRYRSKSIKELSLTGGFFEYTATFDGKSLDRVSVLEDELQSTRTELAETKTELYYDLEITKNDLAETKKMVDNLIENWIPH
jgi:hypothetical protein